MSYSAKSRVLDLDRESCIIPARAKFTRTYKLYILYIRCADAPEAAARVFQSIYKESTVSEQLQVDI